MKTRLLLLATLVTSVSACDCHDYLIAAARASLRLVVAATCPEQTVCKESPPAPAKSAPAPKPTPAKERAKRPPRPEYLFM